MFDINYLQHEDMWPKIQKVGQYNNKQIACALAYADGFKILFERLQMQGEPINDNIYREAHSVFVAYLNIYFRMHPICKLKTMDAMLQYVPSDKKNEFPELLICYVSTMIAGEQYYDVIGSPDAIDTIEIDKFQDMLYDFDKEYWIELMADFILGNTFEHNHKHKILLSKDVLNEMHKDIYNRTFAMLEHFGNKIYE